MPESDTNSPSPVEKGTRHIPTSRTPAEFRGAHAIKSEPQSLTDQEIEQDFLAAFAPLEPEPLPASQTNIPETYTGRKEPDNSPSSIALPIGTVIYDEDGEAYKIEKLTEVDGRWIRPSKNKGGPAQFIIEKIFPDGRDAGGKEVNGQFAKRKGKLWYGQITTSDGISSDR